MQTTANTAAPRRDVRLATLLEIADESPTLLLKRCLAIRSQSQSRHSSLCPLVMYIRETEAEGDPMAQWIADDDVAHCFLAPGDGDLKVVFLNLGGEMVLGSASSLGRLAAVHKGELNAAEWADIDLVRILERGQPVVTICDEGHEPAEWLRLVDELVSRFRHEVLPSFEAADVGGDYASAPEAFYEALNGFPDEFVEAMTTLAGEIATLVVYIAGLAGIGQEENPFEIYDVLSGACIGALVPGIRALAFHGFGWPVLPPANAKDFLSQIRDAQPIAVEGVWNLQASVGAEEREALLDHLLQAGVISIEDSMVTVVKLSDFLKAEPDVAQGGNAKLRGLLG